MPHSRFCWRIHPHQWTVGLQSTQLSDSRVPVCSAGRRCTAVGSALTVPERLRHDVFQRCIQAQMLTEEQCVCVCVRRCSISPTVHIPVQGIRSDDSYCDAPGALHVPLPSFRPSRIYTFLTNLIARQSTTTMNWKLHNSLYVSDINITIITQL